MGHSPRGRRVLGRRRHGWCQPCSGRSPLAVLKKGTIVHTDHGSQYTSKAYQQCLQSLGLRISMGQVRTCADNASAESVFAQLKRELVNRRRFDTRQEATAGVNQYFLQFYNPWRQKYRNKRADS